MADNNSRKRVDVDTLCVDQYIRPKLVESLFFIRGTVLSRYNHLWNCSSICIYPVTSHFAVALSSLVLLIHFCVWSGGHNHANGERPLPASVHGTIPVDKSGGVNYVRRSLAFNAYIIYVWRHWILHHNSFEFRNYLAMYFISSMKTLSMSFL